MAMPLDQLEAVMKTLGDRTRLRILGLLLHGEICVCDIHETLRVSQSKVSRHLAVLRQARFVATRRQGLWVQYRLADLSEPTLAAIAEAVCQALVRADVVQRDAARLRQQGSACMPVPITLMRSARSGASARRRLPPVT